jgi:hypothetical protein
MLLYIGTVGIILCCLGPIFRLKFWFEVSRLIRRLSLWCHFHCDFLCDYVRRANVMLAALTNCTASVTRSVTKFDCLVRSTVRKWGKMLKCTRKKISAWAILPWDRIRGYEQTAFSQNWVPWTVTWWKQFVSTFGIFFIYLLHFYNLLKILKKSN